MINCLSQNLSRIEESSIKAADNLKRHEDERKFLEAEIQSLRKQNEEQRRCVENLETNCNDLRQELKIKDSEINDLKQHIDSESDGQGEFKLVQRQNYQRHSTSMDQFKPATILIGTSNTNGIDQNMSSSFTLEKSNAFTLDETLNKGKSLDKQYDAIIFHSLTNDMKTETADTCIGKVRNIVHTAKEKFPRSKIIISCPTLKNGR